MLRHPRDGKPYATAINGTVSGTTAAQAAAESAADDRFAGRYSGGGSGGVWGAISRFGINFGKDTVNTLSGLNDWLFVDSFNFVSPWDVSRTGPVFEENMVSYRAGQAGGIAIDIALGAKAIASAARAAPKALRQAAQRLPVHTAASANVSMARNTAVFWTAIPEGEAAGIARSLGGTTLEDLARTRSFRCLRGIRVTRTSLRRGIFCPPDTLQVPPAQFELSLVLIPAPTVCGTSLSSRHLR